MASRFDPMFGTGPRKGETNLAWDASPTTAGQQMDQDGWMNTDKPVGSQGQITPACGNYPLSGTAGDDGDLDIAATHPAFQTMS